MPLKILQETARVKQELKKKTLSQFPSLIEKITNRKIYGTTINIRGKTTKETAMYVLLDLTISPLNMSWEEFIEHGRREFIENFTTPNTPYKNYHVKNLVKINPQFPA